MKIAIQTVIAKGHVPPLEQARLAYDAGVAGFYAGEHHHLPTATPCPPWYEESGIPDFYKYTPDPLITLASVAGACPGMTVGTAILLAPLHDTIMMASRLGTLDQIAGGRSVIALGIGWNRQEFENHGVDFDTRFEKTVEQVRAMKLLWQDGAHAFAGQFVNFSESWQGPKPDCKPHMPLLLGGRALKRSFRFIAELLDGWMPTDTYERMYGGNLEEQVAMLRDYTEEQGRDPDGLHNVMEYADLFLFDRDPAQYAADAPSREALERLDRLGFKEVIIGLPTFSDSHYRGALDHLVKLAEPWLGRD